MTRRRLRDSFLFVFVASVLVGLTLQIAFYVVARAFAKAWGVL